MSTNNILSVWIGWRQRNILKGYVLSVKLLSKRVSVLSALSSSEMRTLGLLLTAYDQSTNEHAQRVMFLAEAVAHALHLADDEVFSTCLAALLHDIGKAGIPDAILNKAGSLDECEWEIMRRHAEIGQQMLLQAGGIFAHVAPAVLAHHERWDGGGYPGGSSGEKIPLAARIIAVVDSYDAIVQRRVYHEPQSDREVCAELQRCAGSQFDPRIVATFLSLLNVLNESIGQQERSRRIPAVGEVELVGVMCATPSLQSGECVRVSA